MSMPGGLAAGTAVAIVLTLLLSAVTAKLIQSGVLAQENIGYGVMAVLLIASFLGALTAQGRVKHRRSLVCLLSGILYLLVLLAITALFFGGQYTGVWATALVVLAGSGAAAMMQMRRGKGGSRKQLPGRKPLRR